MEPSTTTSIDYPKVQIGTAEYSLRYRHLDIMRLKKAGVNLMVKLVGEALYEKLPLIIHAGLAHLGTSSPTLEQVEEHIGNLDVGDISIYTLAFMEAQKKASAQGEQATAKLKAAAKEAAREQAATQTVN